MFFCYSFAYVYGYRDITMLLLRHDDIGLFSLSPLRRDAAAAAAERLRRLPPCWPLPRLIYAAMIRRLSATATL